MGSPGDLTDVRTTVNGMSYIDGARDGYGDITVRDPLESPSVDGTGNGASGDVDLTIEGVYGIIGTVVTQGAGTVDGTGYRSSGDHDLPLRFGRYGILDSQSPTEHIASDGSAGNDDLDGPCGEGLRISPSAIDIANDRASRYFDFYIP